nr:JmjC domain-containing protein [Tanacetum cinerariifolium]
MASGGSDRDAKDALSKLLQMGEAFFKARIIEARFKDERSTTAIAKATDLNTGVHIQDLELETKVLVDGKQDDAKVVKVAGVAGHENSDEPNVLKGNRVIGVGVNENNKGVDKEVQYFVYTLHVLIPFLKRLNDKCIKKKKMEAAIQRRL